VLLAGVLLGAFGWLPPSRAFQLGESALVPEPDAAKLTAEYHQDFRDAKFDFKSLKLVGGSAEQLVKAERDGLHVRIPAGLENPAAVGITPRFRIHGDFEITVSFAIVKADAVVRGYGLGAAIWVETDTETAEAVTIERGVLPKEGDRYTSTRISGPPPPESRKYDVRRAPAESRFGALRMARVGSLIITSFADGGKEPFHVLRTVELGPEDLTLCRLSADTGVSNHGVEVRFEDLTIRAEALPGYAGAAQATAPDRFPWVLVGGAVVGFALLAVLVWWLAAAKRSATQGPPAVPRRVRT
jgi:hypothetical protein